MYFEPGGDSHIEWTGMLVGNFDPSGRDLSGRGRSLCRPLKETSFVEFRITLL